MMITALNSIEFEGSYILPWSIWRPFSPQPAGRLYIAVIRLVCVHHLVAWQTCQKIFQQQQQMVTCLHKPNWVVHCHAICVHSVIYWTRCSTEWVRFIWIRLLYSYWDLWREHSAWLANYNSDNEFYKVQWGYYLALAWLSYQIWHAYICTGGII